MTKKISITITVTISRVAGELEFTYVSTSPYVGNDGSITIPYDSKAKIKWKRDKEQKDDWDFEAPFVSFETSGPYTPTKRAKDETEWEDVNVLGEFDLINYYYLHTTPGKSPDPMLTNEGSAGGGPSDQLAKLAGAALRRRKREAAKKAAAKKKAAPKKKAVPKKKAAKRGRS